jgi:BASS family bile acid:Na+ symporter
MKYLKDRNFIFIAAVVFGLALPQAGIWSKNIMLPALAVVMALATTAVPNDFIRSGRKLLKPFAAGIILSYIILGGLLLALSHLFILNDNIRIGFVLVAAVPPAVAVIPFTAILKGDVTYTLAATVSAYLVALFVMPLMFFLFIAEEFSQTNKLVEVIVLLIILPMVVSRIILFLNWREKIEKFRGPVTDWGFFIVLYTLVALNRDLIFARPDLLLPVIIIIFGAIFFLGFIVEKAGNLLNRDRAQTTSWVLLSTLKNQGIAGGLAVTLFPEETALPSAVYTAFMIFYFMWLDFRRKLQER